MTFIFIRLLIASSDDPDENLILYYGNESHAGISPFNYHFLTTVNSTSNAEDIKSMIEEWISYIPGNVATNWPVMFKILKKQQKISLIFIRILV